MLVVASILWAGTPASPRAATSYLIESEGRSEDVPTLQVRGREYFELGDLEKVFGLRRVDTGRKSLRLDHPNGSLSLKGGSALVEARGQPILLGTEVVRRRKRYYVPLDFVTRAMARLLGVEARHDPRARSIRFDARSEVVRCQAFADRTRVTLALERPPAFAEIIRDGRRRMLELTNQELPSQVGGCLFDETLADLEIRPSAGRTRITFFVGSRFTSLKVYELPDSLQLVFDFFNDSAIGEVEPTPTLRGSAADLFDTIVLDPGHGGADTGAVGPTGLQEKDLTLAIARLVARQLRGSGLGVVLTRDGDEEVGLVARTEIANRSDADLFLSIHANATVGPSAHGAETYFLDAEATDEDARTTSALENDVTGLRRGGLRDRGGPLEILLWDMAQQQYLEESSDLAEAVQAQLNELAGTADRGVKQANFLVLRGATMPAVLVEVGFLSSPTEERALRTLQFQQATAEALVRAILSFRDARRARRLP